MENSQKIFHLKPDSTPNAQNKKDLSAYYSKEVFCVILNSFVFLIHAFFQDRGTSALSFHPQYHKRF